MELTDALLAQIGAYLSGEMNESERQAFDDRIRLDDDLRREVILQHELKQGLSLIDQKQRFKTMHTDLRQRGLLIPDAGLPSAPALPETGRTIPFPGGQTAFWSTWNYGSVAASLVLLAGISGFFYWKQTIPTTADRQREKAYYSAFTPDLKAVPIPPADPDRLGASPADPAGLHDSVQLQEGVNRLQRQQVQPAIRQLLPIARGLPGHWRASAQWYLALAYLRNGQLNQTDSLLTLIADANGHPYQLEARHLTDQLTHPQPGQP